MFKSILVVMTIFFAGCTINIPSNQLQPPIEEKKVVAQIEMKQDEKVKHKPWPQEEKEYWYARYFFNLAMNPRVQQMLKPRSVFEIVKCSVTKYEEDYSWKWFVENLHDQKSITPEISKYVYDVTKVCSDKQKAIDYPVTPAIDIRETI
jgi:hypothetical protein